MSPYIVPGLKFRNYREKNEYKFSSFNRILRIILNNTGVTKRELFQKTRTRKIADLRMIAMWIIRNHTNATLVSVAEYFNMHHATVIHACRTIQIRIDCNDEYVVRIIGKIKHYL